MIEIIKKSDSSLPIKHQLGKLILGTLAGFAASALAEKGYDIALECHRLRKTAI